MSEQKPRHEVEGIVRRAQRQDVSRHRSGEGYQKSCGGKSTQLSYLSKSIDTLIESYSSKSHPVKYYFSKTQSIWF
jgi:hypothetical protein